MDKQGTMAAKPAFLEKLAVKLKPGKLVGISWAKLVSFHACNTTFIFFYENFRNIQYVQFMFPICYVDKMCPPRFHNFEALTPM